jgi:hypothetical protein
MGIRIHRSTWSTPLQLIDSWLPAARQPSTTTLSLSRVAARFAKAGWLQRKASNDPIASPPSPSRDAPAAPCLLRVAPHVRSSGCADSRVRLSGRLVDVCAELERLAACDMSQRTKRG